MAQPQKPNPQAKDPYAQRTKTLTSTAQKVRGWVGSDPSRTAELADALVELTAHRLLGHAWAVAATDAQEAVKLSAQLLTANGPIGPYTAIEDAVRYVTAVVQFAAVQVGLGLPEAAGRSIASLDELQEQVGTDAITRSISARTAIWALSSSARAALASGEVAAANAYADAAQDRLADSRSADDPDSAYLVLDTDRLSADARWAAGDAEASLTYLIAAKSRFDDVVAGRLAEPARLNDGLRERLAEPVAGLDGDLADRFFAVGEQNVALAVRRELVATLRKLAERSPESNRMPLAAALGSLGADLAAAGRDGEAAPVMAEAEALDSVASLRSRAPLGGSVRWEALPGSSAYVVAAAGSGRAERETDLAAGAASRWRAAARVEAERSETALREAAATDAQRAADAEAAERKAEADRQTREQAAAERAAEAEAEERAAAEEAEREERKRRRAERIEAHRRLEEQQEAERRAAEQAEYERRVTEHGDSAEIERLELERLQAEIDELEERELREAEAERRAAEEAEDARRAAARAEADRLAAERDEAEESERRREESERRAVEEAEEARLEAEQAEEAGRAAERADAEAEERADAEAEERAQSERLEAERAEFERAEFERAEFERAEFERAEFERAEAERVEAERVETAQIEAELAEAEDELVVAQRAWNEAKSRGDRRAIRTANERVVELLRPRAQEDLGRYGPPLVSALEDLSRARLRGGDIFGSRGPAKEAKALAKSLGS